MNTSVNAFLEAQVSLKNKEPFNPNGKYGRIPMELSTDVLLALGFLYKDFTSMQNQKMTCCVLNIGKTMEDKFKQFQIEGVPQTKDRRTLAECAMAIVKIARDLIDHYPEYAQSKTLQEIQKEREAIPLMIETSITHALELRIPLELNSQYIAFSAIEYQALLNQFGTVFKSQ